MALTFNGTAPTEIVYNGTSLTVLNQDGTNVWGKPFTLTVNKGTNIALEISRTSSPNQHASTGSIISYSSASAIANSGSTSMLVYYGDVLTITASASSGYNLTTFTVNGTAWTSGNSITVSSAITVVTVAQSAVSWHTVWTGSSSKYTYIASNSTATLTWSSSDISGINTSYPLRISGTKSGDGTTSFTNVATGSSLGSVNNGGAGTKSDPRITAALVLNLASPFTVSISTSQSPTVPIATNSMYVNVIITSVDAYY